MIKNLSKKVLIFIMSCIFVMSFSFVSYAMSIYNGDNINDYAEILSNSEEDELISDINKIKNTYNMDVVIVTTNDIEGKTQMEYADDYYDYNGYGLDDRNSGLLLLIDMNDREIWISTTGHAIDYFSDYRIEKMVDNITEYLKDDEYYEGCSIFLGDIKYYIDKGLPSATENSTAIFIIIAIGVICGGIGCIVVSISYRHPSKAKNISYVKKESIKYNEKTDILISSHTSKSKKNKDNNSSSTHTSSSGETHGGGGGKF